VNEFMTGKRKILVATDVVARGIDTVNVTTLLLLLLLYYGLRVE